MYLRPPLNDKKCYISTIIIQFYVVTNQLINIDDISLYCDVRTFILK